MPFSLAKQQGLLKLRLEGEVTIRDARKLAAALTGGLASSEDDLAEGIPVDVETSQLADIDTCILQLLCALNKSVRQVTFGNPGVNFLSALERSQLRKALLGARETI